MGSLPLHHLGSFSHSNHAPAKGKRNLKAGIVRSYKCVDLSLSIVLWTVRRALCDLVGFSVTSLALFVPQRDYIPATHASSGPLNLLLCLQELDTTDLLTHTHCLQQTGRVKSELSFKAGPGTTAVRKSTLTLSSFLWTYIVPFVYFHYWIYHALSLTCQYLSSLHSAFYS